MIHLSMMPNSIILLSIMNPFRFGEVVTRNDFCPRPELVKQLTVWIEGSGKVAVLGERRTGKTSLIHEAVSRLKGYHLIYAQLWAVRSVEDVANHLLRAISTARIEEGSLLDKLMRAVALLRPRIEFDPLTGQPSVTVTPGAKITPTGLHNVFDFIQDLSPHQRIVVALDEFQDIRRLPEADAVLGELRSRIQRQRGVAYIFAGSIRHEMEAIFRTPASPFFKSMRTLEVGGIPREQFRSFLDSRFKSGRRSLSDDAYQEIFSISEDNPSDVQQFCSAIWDRSEPGSKIGNSEVIGALTHVLATERKGYEQQIQLLTAIQKRCLRALAKLGGQRPQAQEFLKECGVTVPATVKKSLTRLVDLAIIYGPDLDYKFFDPFFRQWVLRNV